MRFALIAVLLLAHPAIAQEKSYVDGWIERRFEMADVASRNTLEAPEAEQENAGLEAIRLEYHCMSAPIDICRFSAAPENCMDEVIVIFDTLQHGLFSNLPAEYDGGPVAEKRYREFRESGGRKLVETLRKDCVTYSDTFPSPLSDEKVCALKASALHLSQTRYWARDAGATQE